MLDSPNLLANLLSGLVVGYAFYRIWSAGFRGLSKEYPFPDQLKPLRCGLYGYRRGLFWGWVRIDVNWDGLAITNMIVPFPFFPGPRAFVPWSDVHVRKQPTSITLGFTQVPSYELRLNKIVLKTMQHRLRGQVPFGHVD